LKAGEYDFDQPASTLAVLRKLVRGDVSFEILTVPEGSNRFEIADLVAEHGFSTREEFLAATEDPQAVAALDPNATDLEGYLFPDSYRFPRHARPADIVRAMVRRFREIYTGLQSGETSRSTHEIVTIASLVETETWLDQERSVIAGVFYNRLRRGMALQADPTVSYAMLLAEGYSGQIRLSDLSFSSPYNTYVNKGLPAGPIANPGKASLEAAIRPADTEYLYFVASVAGGHVFSRTLAEHNRAVEQYRNDRNRSLLQREQSRIARSSSSEQP
jgi:UPF0755 protein